MSERTKYQLQRLQRQNLYTLALDEGVEVSEDATKPQIIHAMIQAGKVRNQTPGEEETDSPVPSNEAREAPTVEPEEDGVKKDLRRSPFSNMRKVFLTIHSTDEDDGARPVDVTVNGYNFRIPRDKEVQVPYPVLEVLQNAVETRLEEIGRDQVTGAPKFRNRHSRRFALSSNAA